MKLAHGRIEPNTTALVVVDMQRLFLAPGAPWEVPTGRGLLPTLLPTIAAARVRDAPRLDPERPAA